MLRLLVAVPTFNERDHVALVITEIRRYVSDVVVVDDGSDDGTTKIVEETAGIQKIFHLHNYGYGQSLISAFNYAIKSKYDWLITMDCDEQHEPALLPDFIQAIKRNNADIISGSRYLQVADREGEPPIDRRRINMHITRALNELLSLSLTDAFCGFKAYRCTSLAKLSIDVQGYAMPLQLWVQAVHQGLRIREIPVRLIYNDPNRHFGGGLDDPEYRLEHYRSVLCSELKKTQLLQKCGSMDGQGSLVCP